jgi:hypothetical protein
MYTIPVDSADHGGFGRQGGDLQGWYFGTLAALLPRHPQQT